MSGPRCPNTGKRRHGSYTEARDAPRRIRSARRSGKRESRTYRCEVCGDWHLTSLARRRVAR